MKYICFRDKLSDFYHTLIFSEELIHKDMLNAAITSGACPFQIGAGFYEVDAKFKLIKVHGRASSLDIGPYDGPDFAPLGNRRDTMLLGLAIFDGLSGLALQNWLMQLKLEGLAKGEKEGL